MSTKSDIEKLQNLRTEIKSAGGQTLKEAAGISDAILVLDAQDPPTADSVAMTAVLGVELAERVQALLQLMAAEKLTVTALNLSKDAIEVDPVGAGN